MIAAALYAIAAVLFVWTLAGGLGGSWSPNRYKRWHGHHRTHREAEDHNPLDFE